MTPGDTNCKCEHPIGECHKADERGLYCTVCEGRPLCMIYRPETDRILAEWKSAESDCEVDHDDAINLELSQDEMGSEYMSCPKCGARFYNTEEE